MSTLRIASVIALVAAGWTGGYAAPAAAQEAKVRAVMFYSPTCQHCEQVINQDLPTFYHTYGGPPQVLMDRDAPEFERFAFLITNGRLEILMVDASRQAGGVLYQASLESFPTEPRRLGVPRLIVNDQVLVGSVEIPSRLHEIIQDGLAAGGTAWPTIVGLDEAMAPLTPAPVASEDPPAQQAPAPEEAEPPAADTAMVAIPFEQIGEQPSSLGQRFLRDPLGNGTAVVVLLLMVASVIAVPRLATAGKALRAPSVTIPLVALLGIAVAGYLTYIEATGATAVCGPVGDCNAVQQSEYATLFGILPVGLLGLIGYVVIIAAWLVAGAGRGRAAEWAAVALVATAFVGTVFSIYLTFLEPFVIGATCAWCLTSAVLITLLLWLSAGAGTVAWTRLTSHIETPHASS
jgi:uncharacterized membrane protein